MSFKVVKELDGNPEKDVELISDIADSDLALNGAIDISQKKANLGSVIVIVNEATGAYVSFYADELDGVGKEELRVILSKKLQKETDSLESLKVAAG
jgi:hypothetical protein